MRRFTGLAVALASILVAALGFAPSSAFADTTALGGVAGDLYPTANNDIRMEAETVQAICYRYVAEFHVDFEFVNSGDAQTVQLGFPYLAPAPYTGVTPPIGFQAWQDGVPLEVSLAPSTSAPTTIATGPTPPVESYFLMKASFPPGKTMIAVSYVAQPTWFGYNRLPASTPADVTALSIEGRAAKYDYWLHTGAGWAGTIGKAVVRFQFADDFDGWAVDAKASDPAVKASHILPPTTKPETYTRSDASALEWVFEDLEPTEADDIVLAFSGDAFEMLQSQVILDQHGEMPAAYGALPVPITASGNLAYHYSRDDPSAAKDGWWAVDSSLVNPWGVPAPGKGAWIKLGVQGDHNLKEIRILPGSIVDAASFMRYGRPKTMRVTLSDGTSSTISLKDEPSLQRFPISGNAEWLKLDILDIYRGTESDDTYISLIDLGTEPAPSFLPFAELISSKAASSPVHLAGQVIWPIVGVVVVAGATLLLAWVARRRRRIRKARGRGLDAGTPKRA
jgi:hypothetical protein